MQIKQLHLTNFRAFKSATIPFAPITILVGPNNAGKSSVLSVLRLLSQTLRSVDPQTTMLLEGFGVYRDIVYENDNRREIKIKLDFEDQEKRGGIELSYGYRAQRREVVLRSFRGYELPSEGTSSEESTVIRTSYSEVTGNQLLRELRGFPSEEVDRVKVKAYFYHFVPVLTFQLWEQIHRALNKRSKKPDSISMMAFSKQIQGYSRVLRQLRVLLGSSQYLGPFREAPLRIYPFSGERPSRLSASGAEATDVLTADYFKRGKLKRELTRSVKDWLINAEIASDLVVEAVSDRHYVVQLKHPKTGELSNIADVGFGASQILPVLVAGYSSMEETIFMVEQPELHLHPRSQSELGDFLLDIYRKKVQCVVETHSENLIMRLQRKVADGSIPSKDIAISYINATDEGKAVIPLPLNADGIFTEPWPRGFFEDRMHEALQLARAPLHRGAKG
jgi:predicted ATPase